jgi:hypothetical protein
LLLLQLIYSQHMSFVVRTAFLSLLWICLPAYASGGWVWVDEDSSASAAGTASSSGSESGSGAGSGRGGGNHIQSWMCEQSIIRHLRTLESSPVAQRMPYGRAYLANRFGQALYHYTTVAHTVTYTLRSCYISQNRSYYAYTPELCSTVSLHALMVGDEVVGPKSIVASVVTDFSGGPPVCEWNATFPDMVQEGVYQLQVWTHSVNEFSDPTSMEMNADKTDRHNAGTTVSLSGLGVVNGLDLYPIEEFDFTGHTVRRTTGKSIYFVVNQTAIRGFQNFGAYLAGHFEPKNEIVLRDAFFEHVREIRPGFDETLGPNLPKPTDISLYLSVLKDPTTYLTYGQTAFNESLAFNLPVVKVEPNVANRSVKHNRVLCRDGTNDTFVSQGRWVRVQECEEHNSHFSKEQETFFSRFNAGHVCQHAETTREGNVPHRLRGLIWKPWSCNIVQLDTVDMKVDIAVAHQLQPSVFCDIVNTMDGSSTSDTLYFSKAADNYFKSVALKGGVNASNVNTSVSLSNPLSLCLRSAGIGLIAGFGDSLGIEQLDNFQNLLSNVPHWSDEGHRLNCIGSVKNHLHFIKNGPALAKCIEDAAVEMLNREPRISLFRNYPGATKPSNESLASTVATSVPVKTVVLITNFMAQHIGMKFPIAEIESLLIEQAKLHASLAERLKSRYNLQFRRIFLSGISVHGFKVSGLTNARQQWFNTKAADILSTIGGFEVFDSFNVTQSRPDGTRDGIHYRGGVSRALTDLLVDKLCLSYCMK